MAKKLHIKTEITSSSFLNEVINLKHDVIFRILPPVKMGLDRTSAADIYFKK